jgi:hypothetical protein
MVLLAVSDPASAAYQKLEYLSSRRSTNHQTDDHPQIYRHQTCAGTVMVFLNSSVKRRSLKRRGLELF